MFFGEAFRSNILSGLATSRHSRFRLLLHILDFVIRLGAVLTASGRRHCLSNSHLAVLKLERNSDFNCFLWCIPA